MSWRTAAPASWVASLLDPLLRATRTHDGSDVTSSARPICAIRRRSLSSEVLRGSNVKKFDAEKKSNGPAQALPIGVASGRNTQAQPHRNDSIGGWYHDV